MKVTGMKLNSDEVLKEYLGKKETIGNYLW